MGDLAPEYIRELLVRFSLEAVFLTMALALAWWRFGLNGLASGLGRRRVLVVATFVVSLTVVQLVDRWQYEFPPRVSFYPLARFAMYQTGTIGEDGILTYRFLSRTAAGEEEVDVTELFGAVGLPSLNTRFRIIGERLVSGDAEDRRWAEEQVRRYAASIVNRAEAHGDPLPLEVAFEVWRYPVGSVRPEGGERIDRIVAEVGAP